MFTPLHDAAGAGGGDDGPRMHACHADVGTQNGCDAVSRNSLRPAVAPKSKLACNSRLHGAVYNEGSACSRQ